MTEHLRRASRALISVSDKSGLVDFAATLLRYGIELVSTGGTGKALSDAGLKVLDVGELTGVPEMMGGRVKTLHPAVHGGLLAVRGNPEHVEAMRAHHIRPIDVLVVNLYPFEETVARGGDFASCIENIDIGGPAMIRAAAKNHEDVAVLVDAGDYALLLEEFARHDGMTTLALRRRLAAKAFARTAAYDAAIANWFARELGELAPDYRAFGGHLIEKLRYGENPHQSAAFYRTPDARFGVATARQVQGKQLSYNNINDTDAAYECVAEFDPARGAACAIIKHANPCGVAEGTSLVELLSQGARLRSAVRVRRRRRAQPQARCRSGARDYRNLHRGHYRAGRQRGSHRHRRGQEKPAASARRWLARSARAWPDGENRGRRAPGAVARQRRGR